MDLKYTFCRFLTKVSFSQDFTETQRVLSNDLPESHGKLDILLHVSDITYSQKFSFMCRVIYNHVLFVSIV